MVQALNLVTGVLMRKEGFAHTVIDTYTEGRLSYEKTGRKWRSVAVSQGISRIASNHQKLRKGRINRALHSISVWNCAACLNPF